MNEALVEKQDSHILITLSGHIDSANAESIRNEIFAEIGDEKGSSLTVKAENLEYISSAGLRIFLTLRKAAEDKGGKIIIQNINDDIRSVFMMTGFLNLFEIR